MYYVSGLLTASAGATVMISGHVEDELKQELDDMEQKDVIKKTTEPTDWVSSMVISRRKNGKLRVYVWIQKI